MQQKGGVDEKPFCSLLVVTLLASTGVACAFSRNHLNPRFYGHSYRTGAGDGRRFPRPNGDSIVTEEGGHCGRELWCPRRSGDPDESFERLWESYLVEPGALQTFDLRTAASPPGRLTPILGA